MGGQSKLLIRPLLQLWIGIALLLPPVHAWPQADYAREQRWADEIVPAIVVGDAVRLELKSGRKVLAIYTPAPKASAGVVVVHGLGVNPDTTTINDPTGRPQHLADGHAIRELV